VYEDGRGASELLIAFSFSLSRLQTLFKIAEKVKNFAVIYLVDTSEVPDFNKMYELYDPTTVMFFFRNKHIMIDLGTCLSCLDSIHSFRHWQ
jgi:hypothetical protein